MSTSGGKYTGHPPTMHAYLDLPGGQIQEQATAEEPRQANYSS